MRSGSGIRSALGSVRKSIREHPIFAGIYNGSAAFSGPLQAHIDLTNKCNLRCVCCWNRSPLLAPGDRLPGWDGWELDYDKVIELLNDLGDLGVPRIIFSGGGDPIFYPRLFDVLGYATSQGMRKMLVSNLTMADSGTMEKILNSGVEEMLVSLWAATPETYVATHPGCRPEQFEHIIGMIGELTRRRKDRRSPELIIMNVISNLNYLEIEKMISLAIDLGAARVWFQLVDVQAEPLKRFLLTREQLAWLENRLDEIASLYRGRIEDWQEEILDFNLLKRRALNNAAEKGLYQTDFIDDIPCYMGWVDTRILANGDVCPCCTGDRFHIDNIYKKRFKEIWDSSRYREFRRRAKTISKKDPYFSKIKCFKVCDDWGLNESVNGQYLMFLEELTKMPYIERLLWNLMSRGRFGVRITP